MRHNAALFTSASGSSRQAWGCRQFSTSTIEECQAQASCSRGGCSKSYAHTGSCAHLTCLPPPPLRSQIDEINDKFVEVRGAPGFLRACTSHQQPACATQRHTRNPTHTLPHTQARDEIEYAAEDAESTYFNESVATARTAVAECVSRYDAVLASLGDDERSKLQVRARVCVRVCV